MTSHLPSPVSHRPFAVLFDLDGTLIDSIGLIVAAMEYAYDDRPHRPPVNEWLAEIGTPLDGMLRRWARDDADVVHLRTRYREYQHEHHDEMTRPFPGVVETVRALHAAGHPLAVVTSKLEVGARRSLKYIEIEECFGAVVGMDATKRHKPDPEPVHYALERLGGLPTSRALFIGDSVHDLRSGNAAGVATGAALWGPSKRDELAVASPTHWLDSIADVRTLLEQLAMK